MERIYLSRRNLLTLLSKLDRQSAGDSTQCTIIKNDSANGPYSQTMDQIAVTAVEDKDYYLDRAAGEVHSADIPNAHYDPGYQ